MLLELVPFSPVVLPHRWTQHNIGATLVNNLSVRHLRCIVAFGLAAVYVYYEKDEKPTSGVNGDIGNDCCRLELSHFGLPNLGDVEGKKRVSHTCPATKLDLHRNEQAGNTRRSALTAYECHGY
jgi:hypothetical protein